MGYKKKTRAGGVALRPCVLLHALPGGVIQNRHNRGLERFLAEVEVRRAYLRRGPAVDHARLQERGGLFLPAVRDILQVLINRVQLVKDLPDSLPNQGL